MLLLDTEPGGRKWKKRFYFDRNWLKNLGVGEVVSRAWSKQQTGSRCYILQLKIKECRWLFLTGIGSTTVMLRYKSRV